MELYNGYFDQYFVNSSSDYAGEVVAALQTIGAHRAAQITADAFAYVFPNGVVPADQGERCAQREAAEARDPRYNQITDTFSRYYCRDEDNIYDLLTAYARRQSLLVDP